MVCEMDGNSHRISGVSYCFQVLLKPSHSIFVQFPCRFIDMKAMVRSFESDTDFLYYFYLLFAFIIYNERQ